MLGCTTLLQSMQLHTYMNGGNLWLPPLLWPNLHSTLHSSMTGNSSSLTPALQALNEAAGVQQSAAPLACCPPVKCSVVKSIGSIDTDCSHHHQPLNQNSTPFFCRQLCWKYIFIFLQISFVVILMKYCNPHYEVLYIYMYIDYLFILTKRGWLCQL